MPTDETTQVHQRIPCREPQRECRYDEDRSAINRQLRSIQDTLAEIQADLRVGQSRFGILEKIVFGACAVVGVTVIGGLIATIINKT